jgi:hypothetical protein
MRSTSSISSARFVMTAETCGRSSRAANVAPPLKSTRMKLSSSEECVAIREPTMVRSTSDLPEPVAPMSRPCGPMPPTAASLKSMSTIEPSGPGPMGTFR